VVYDASFVVVTYGEQLLGQGRSGRRRVSYVVVLKGLVTGDCGNGLEILSVFRIPCLVLSTVTGSDEPTSLVIVGVLITGLHRAKLVQYCD
jgi:hypothetical protein